MTHLLCCVLILGYGILRIILLVANALVLAFFIYKWNSQLARLPSHSSLVRRQGKGRLK